MILLVHRVIVLAKLALEIELINAPVVMKNIFYMNIDAMKFAHRVLYWDLIINVGVLL